MYYYQTKYLTEFYKTKSAKEIAPMLIEWFSPKSVIDIGCGIGSWLKAFMEESITEVLGLDGEYVDKTKLLIPETNFIAYNLEQSIRIDKKYDLLICLEVAEHLSETRAESFISDLCKISDTILFSAAIPFQGGHNHVNEQYPNYWINLFAKKNFMCKDIIRPLIWNNNKINWWYRQNIVIAKKEERPINLKKDLENINPLISKELYELKMKEIENLKDEIKVLKAG